MRALEILTNLPRPVLRLLAGRPIVIDGAPMDLQSQVLNRIVKLVARRPIEEVPPAETRRLMEEFAAKTKGVSSCPSEDIELPGPAGAIPVRRYRPRDAEPGAALVYFHGGGWVIGSPNTCDVACGELAMRSRCQVFSIDYRLAPEHRYPAALDDCHAAFHAIAERAGEFDVDPELVAVGGDSAGGNLAAALCIRNREQGGRQARFQLLVYPLTDAAGESESYELFADGFLLTRGATRWFIDQYVPDTQRRGEVGVSPLLAGDLSGLPPAHVVIAGYDPLRDEGRAYASKLSEAGVAVTSAEYPGTFHCFFGMTALDVCHDALTTSARALRAALVTDARS